ncbi:MAG: DnaD domain-containing protein, partial [Clostridium sp.]
VEFQNKGVYDVYSSCGFGLINPLIIEKIDEDINIFSKECVIEALEIAAKNNKHSLSYVEGILRNWRAKGKGIKKEEEEKKDEEYADDFDRLLGSDWYKN